MRRQHVFGFVAVLLVLCAVGGFLLWKFWGVPSFSDIKQEDVDHVIIALGLNKEYPLDMDDQVRLVDCLRQVKCYRTLLDYREYNGFRSQMFVLHMVNGTQLSISACSPFFIVNGVSYGSNSRSCSEINDLYSYHMRMAYAWR